jgi:methyl-accepting chemotaxis protein
MSSTKAARLGALAVATALLLAAGCGGSDDETSGATDWANSVCSAATTWSDSVSAAATSLQGGNLSEDSLKSAVDDVTESTKTLADDLKDAGKPDTEDGQKAKDLIDQLADQVDEAVQTMEDAVDDVQGGTGILTAISQISGTLASMTSEIGGIVDQLEQLDPGAELDDAFKNADECASLRSGG